MLGLIGIYLVHHGRLNALASTGFAIAVPAIAFIAGPEVSIFEVNTYAIGVPIIGFGLLLFSIGQIQAGICGHAAPITLSASVILGGVAMALPALPVLFVLSGILFGTAFVISGVNVIEYAG